MGNVVQVNIGSVWLIVTSTIGCFFLFLQQIHLSDVTESQTHVST